MLLFVLQEGMHRNAAPLQVLALNVHMTNAIESSRTYTFATKS